MTDDARMLIESIQQEYKAGKRNELQPVPEDDKRRRIKKYREFFNKTHCSRFQFRGYPVSVWMVPHEFAVIRPCFDHCINSPCSTFDLMRAHEQNQIVIQEALMKTYPVSTLLRVFRSTFDECVKPEFRNLKMSDFGMRDYGDQLARDTYELNGMNNDTGIANQVIVYAPFVTDEDAYDFEKKVMTFSQFRGYGLSKSGIDEDAQPYKSDNGAEALLYFFTLEARYAIAKFKMSDVMHHVVPVNVLHKVARDGLHPRTLRDASFTYKSSVYLFVFADRSIVLEYGLTKAQSVSQHAFALLKVDTEKLMSIDSFKSGVNQFFVDQKMPGIEEDKPYAIYTYGNVPLSCIDDDIEVFEFDDRGVIVIKRECKLSDFR